MNEGVEVSGVVYGVRIRGRLPAELRPYLLPGAAEAVRELRIGHRLVDELPAGGAEGREVWASETAEGGRFALFRLPDGFGLSIVDRGRGYFRCSSRAIEIDWTSPGTGAEHYLFTYALPLWLEAEGVPVLHASAVSVGGRAVAFLGPSGTGKSLLCAELLRRGCGFVADDGLALRRSAPGEWRCSPGPPLLRLWPSGLERRLEIAAGPLPRVHETLEKRRLLLDSVSEGGSLPLAAVYLLHRRPETSGAVEVGEVAPRGALVRLLEHGVAGAPAAALGHSARRLDLLADVAEKVPVHRLDYPTGTDTAARVLDAITRA